LAGLPDHLINRLPVIKVQQDSKLLAPGRQCRLCLLNYKPGQLVRKLPCSHIFHRDCIDKWLRDDHRCCPIDKKSVYDMLIHKEILSISREANNKDKSKRESTIDKNFCVPGVKVVQALATSNFRKTAIKKQVNKNTTKKTFSAGKQQAQLFDSDTNQRLPVRFDKLTGQPLTLQDLICQAQSRFSKLEKTKSANKRKTKNFKSVPTNIAENLKSSNHLQFNLHVRAKSAIDITRRQTVRGNRLCRHPHCSNTTIPKTSETLVPLFLSGLKLSDPKKD